MRDGIREGAIQDIDAFLLICMMASSLSGLISHASSTEDPAERKEIPEEGLISSGMDKKHDGEGLDSEMITGYAIQEKQAFPARNDEMTRVFESRDLSKTYGTAQAVDHVNLLME